MQAMIAPTSRRPHPFTRAAFAIAQGLVTQREPAGFLHKSEDTARAILTRADQTLGTTTGSHWADDLAQDALRGYLSDLQPFSGAARLIAQAVPAQVRPVETNNYPVRAAGATSLAFVGEGEPIPIRNYVFSLVSVGPARKMSAIIPWSRELSKRSDAEVTFNTMLREDLAAGIDAAFFSTSAATTAAPAGLLYNVSATSVPGTPKGDLGALAEAASGSGASGSVTFITTPALLARLRVMEPELAAAADIVASAALPAGRVVACDAQSLLVAIDSAPEIRRSEDATLHLSDVPLEIVSGTGPTTADPVRSLWQTASIGLRILFDLDFAKRRSGAVQYTDVSW